MRPGVTLDRTELRRGLETQLRTSGQNMERILDQVGQRVVELLESYTGERNVRGRRLHLGGWASRTGALADGFAYEVKRDGQGWALSILNTAPHAHLVEAVGGIFVVRGVADPGGPVDRALREAVAELAPTWEVR